MGLRSTPAPAATLPSIFDDDDEPASARACHDCGRRAPPTDTAHTLISVRHGWRLTRRDDGAGSFTMEWRCPACWKAFRDRAAR